MRNSINSTNYLLSKQEMGRFRKHLGSLSNWIRCQLKETTKICFKHTLLYGKLSLVTHQTREESLFFFPLFVWYGGLMIDSPNLP